MATSSIETVFITGADKGLGLSLVSHFLNNGWRVFAGVYQIADDLQLLAPEHDSRLVSVRLDVSDMASVISAYQQVTAQTPVLDILINNAGIHLPSKPSQSLTELDLTDGHLEMLLNVNTFGPLRVTQQFLPLLEKGNHKLIINISSEAGSIASCERTNDYGYCMSKAALNMQSRILQNALVSQGFQVLAIHPGWMRTDMGGEKADIEPAEAAEGIYQLALKPCSAEDAMYVDFRGNPLPW